MITFQMCVVGSVQRSRASRLANKLCSLESWKKRLPITIWLPKYSFAFLLRDIIAGVTVGLTSIPQGLAYAIVAGLPPQVGLYSSIFPGIVYTLFGSCKDVTVGPTAILAALLAKYVAQSEDLAYLAAFLSGCIILLLGVLQLGFLLDFISKPVISGFTAAAALQIGSSQLKSLFRISGSSGQTFISALVNFFKHITTVQLWDTLLGVVTVISLFLLKRIKVSSANTEPGLGMCASTCQHVIRARNAIVVFVGTLLAYLLYLRGLQPFALTGKIVGGLPRFGPPPFSTVVNNETVNFVGMLDTFGPQGLVMPLVAILESIAIARAFSGSAGVDATQEMIAIGACNLLSAFAQSMPIAGSFTRTALNHASGVKTSAGAFFKAILVLLALTLLADAFHFIPRSTLAAIIMVAMVSIIDLSIVNKLWRNSKIELSIYAVTVVTGISAGLEYGILAGAAADALRALASSARPTLHAQVFKVGNEECVSLTLEGRLWYASAAYVTHRIRRTAPVSAAFLVLDGRHLIGIDIGVAESLISVIHDLESREHKFLLWNFPEHSQKLVEELDSSLHSRFVSGPSIDQHVLGLHLDHRNNALP